MGRKTPTYSSWKAMIVRCHRTTGWGYAEYGAKGVTVCERWRRFAQFLEDMGERPTGTSIDRIDGTKGYEPGNCRWATRSEQNLNRRKYVIVNKNRNPNRKQGKKSPGRPRIADPASVRINVRVTRSEREEYKAKAKRAKAPGLSAWLKGLADREP